jgi:hypothetical protein
VQWNQRIKPEKAIYVGAFHIFGMKPTEREYMDINETPAKECGVMRSTDDIIHMATPTTTKQSRVLLDFSQLTHDHPGLFDQLADLVYARVETNKGAASVREAFERLRLDIHISMSNDLVPLMARALLYVHPDLTGMVKLQSRPLDEALGMRVCQNKWPSDYARRLEWCDGRPLTEAPLPTFKKTVQSVRPAQAELFEVA